MKNILKFIKEAGVLLAFGILLQSSLQAQIRYKIELLSDDSTYQVSLQSDTTFTGMNAITSTGQVTILAPAGDFEITNLVSVNGVWENNTNINAPSENNSTDYFIVGLTSLGTTEIEFTEEEETVLFTFNNGGTCTGNLELMQAGDAFEPPNSLNINAGNEMIIFGYGNQNAWVGNYDQGSAPCPPDNPDCEKPIQYTVELLADGETYQVSMLSSETYTGIDALTNSAQVTIVVPTGGFTITDLQNVNGIWENNTNAISPDENSGFDYLIVGLTNNGTNSIPYVAGELLPLFTFKNGGICTGDLTLMEEGDPFYPPNNMNINAGNEILVFGFGNENAWCGNFGDPVSCNDEDCTKPIEYRIELLPDGETYQVWLRSSETYNGVDALVNSGQVTVLTASGGFEVTNLQNITGVWENNTNVVSPVENPGVDYFIFGLTNNGTDDFNFVAGEEIPLFTFQNSGVCTDSLYLMDEGDPFEPMNSLSINAGQEMVIFGFGNQNAWCRNYGNAEGCQEVLIAMKVFLQGPFEMTDTMMHDSLRQLGLIPLVEPYTELSPAENGNFPFTHINYADEGMIDSTVLAITGPDAIVDWVFLEIRNANDSTEVLATHAALVQRDGDVVDTDGSSLVKIDSLNAGDYFVSVRHRNHLGVMTAAPVTLGANPDLIDFTDPATPTFGTLAQVTNNNINMLWAGNGNADQTIIYAGANTDLTQVFLEVLEDPANSDMEVSYISEGYHLGDLDLDGKSIYQGPNNDLAVIFFNILTYPLNVDGLINFIITEQLP